MNIFFQVMVLDSTINSHPIVQTVEHPDQITEIFDTISYSKGAAVLRMLENFMGPEAFRLGISRFLKKFEYQNAVTQDLWTELTSVSTNLNITKIMDTWTRQMGFPLITVDRVKSTHYKISQSRYLLDPSLDGKGPGSQFGYKWEVPITWISNQEPEKVNQKWLSPNDGFIEISVPGG